MKIIDGVTVLNSTEIFVKGPGVNGFVIFSIFLIVISFIFCIIFILNKDGEGIAISIFSIVVFTFLCFSAFLNGNDKASSYMVYDVTIDDSVSLTEFVKHYDIIRQKGLIYTIRERTTE